MLFISDERLEAISALSGLTAEEKGAALADAESVYRYVRRSEGQRDGAVPEDAIREWGEGRDFDPDRLNRALAVLRETGRLVALDTNVSVPEAAA